MLECVYMAGHFCNKAGLAKQIEAAGGLSRSGIIQVQIRLP